MLVDRGPFRRVALKDYLSRMSKPNPKVLFDDNVAKVLEQQGFSWEEDPRSVYDPTQLYTALKRYATKDLIHWDKHIEYGFRKAFKIFAKPRKMRCLEALSDAQVVKEALQLNKSAGLPLMKKKAESLVYSFDREGQIRLGLKAPNPCVAYKRTQKGNKTRLVWGYPLEMTIMEARFARPLINQAKKAHTPMAFAMSKCELGAKLDRHFSNVPGTTVCLDYSKYDSTIPAEFIRRSFGILATWFSKQDREKFGWNTIVKYFISTPIVMPDGHLYTGKNHGVPSGSYFTQYVDSIVNVALCYAMASRFDFRFSERGIFVLGDDSIMRVRGSFSLKAMATYVNRFGMTLHDDEKTIVGKEHFLGALWVKGKPDAPLDELTKKAVYPEQYRDYGGDLRDGPIDVLRSYATSYKSAWKLLPGSNDWKQFVLDKPRAGRKLDEEKTGSASDRFFNEEVGLRFASRVSDSSLSLRFLL